MDIFLACISVVPPLIVTIFVAIHKSRFPRHTTILEEYYNKVQVPIFTLIWKINDDDSFNEYKVFLKRVNHIADSNLAYIPISMLEKLKKHMQDINHSSKDWKKKKNRFIQTFLSEYKYSKRKLLYPMSFRDRRIFEHDDLIWLAASGIVFYLAYFLLIAKMFYDKPETFPIIMNELLVFFINILPYFAFGLSIMFLVIWLGVVLRTRASTLSPKNIKSNGRDNTDK